MSNKTSQCGFNTICIAESLGESEPKTGNHLFNDLENWIKALRPGIGVSHFPISDTQSLVNWLELIKEAALSKGCIPIIHIEAHGSEEGIQLNSGEFVKWKDIEYLLREINILTRNNLLLVVAACFGAHGIHIAEVLEPTPFFGIIGPNVEVSFGECATGYQKFYQSLLTDLNLTTAIQELNSVLKDDNKNFQFHSAQDLFIEAGISFLKNHNSAKARKERQEQLVSRILASPAGNQFTLKKARDFVTKAYRNDTPTVIENFYRNFMMLDKYPENEDRFKLSFEEIKEILEHRREQSIY